MKITSLVDNVAGRCPGEHGLSLWIELSDGRKILFDTGQGLLFLENASLLGINVSEADVLVISHGHYDHIGGLKSFMKVNSKAKAYLRQGAFDHHYSLKDYGMKDIGCHDDVSLYSGRMVICSEDCFIDDGIMLFTNACHEYPTPPGNSNLFASDAVSKDDFMHEQNLLVQDEGKTILFAGCSHCGAANILKTAQRLCAHVDYMVAGMHLMRGCSKCEIEALAHILSGFDGCKFITMHCTGMDNYLNLSENLGDRIAYLSSGDSLEI